MKNKNKKITFDLVVKISLFIIATIIFYFIPYTHDDWAWGSNLGIERLTSFFQDYNGRWVGNLVVLALTRVRILKAIVTAGTLYLILKFIKKIVNVKNDSIVYIALVLLLLIPTRIFAQAIAWTSGFSNYTISFLPILLFIYLNRETFNNKLPDINKKLIIPMFLLGLVASLFLENLTIYNIVLVVFIMGWQLVKNKKTLYVNLAYLIGSISGAILMFSNGAYHNIAVTGDEYRTITQDSLISSSISKYFSEMYKYLFRNNYVILTLIGVLLIIAVGKYLKNKDKKAGKVKTYILLIASIIIIGYLGYTTYVMFHDNINLFIYYSYRNYIEGILSALLYIALIIASFAIQDKAKRNRILFYLISIAVLTAPLFIVSPVGHRNFIQNYILYMLIACELIDYLYNKNNDNDKRILMGISAVIIMCYFVIFGYMFKADMKRINTINNNKNAAEIRIPKMPHPEYLQRPEPTSETFMDRFKEFYGINRKSKVVFVDYKRKDKLSFKEKGDYKVEVSKTAQLHVKGTSGSLVYTSNHPDIIKVNNDGVVQALRPGSAIIKVTNNYGNETRIRVTAVLTEGFITDKDLKNLELDKYDNLMIVAHPDDETLWGGAHLKEGNYLVVCLTNGFNGTRSKEFKKLIEFTKNKGIILNYPDTQDGIRDDWTNVEKGLNKDLTKLITYKDWKTIVTHSPDGGTGHLHHITASNAIYDIVKKNSDLDKLYYFGPFYRKGNIPKDLKRINDEELEYKNKELDIYASVKRNVNQFWAHMVPYEEFVSDAKWKSENLKSDSTSKTDEFELDNTSIIIKNIEPGYTAEVKQDTIKLSVKNKENKDIESIKKNLKLTANVMGLHEGEHEITLTSDINYYLANNVKVTIVIKKTMPKA